MKVWIDKQGGTHYHKETCEDVKRSIEYQNTGKVIPSSLGLPPLIFHYEPIEHRLFRIDTNSASSPHKEYANIIVDGKRYSYCPMCFGDKRK